MTDRGQFGAKTFIKFEKIFELPILSKIDFFQCIDFIPYPQAKRHIKGEGRCLTWEK